MMGVLTKLNRLHSSYPLALHRFIFERRYSNGEKTVSG